VPSSGDHAEGTNQSRTQGGEGITLTHRREKKRGKQKKIILEKVKRRGRPPHQQESNPMYVRKEKKRGKKKQPGEPGRTVTCILRSKNAGDCVPL